MDGGVGDVWLVDQQGAQWWMVVQGTRTPIDLVGGRRPGRCREVSIRCIEGARDYWMVG